MSIIQLILCLAIIGFVLWLVVTYIPMPPPIKQVMIVLIVILVIVWLCSVTGLFSSTSFLTRPIRGGG